MVLKIDFYLFASTGHLNSLTLEARGETREARHERRELRYDSLTLGVRGERREARVKVP